MLKKIVSFILIVFLVFTGSIPDSYASTDVQATPGSYTPASWPVIFTPYSDANGIIYDPGADEHPVDVDFTSGVDRGTGNLPSVYYASDSTNMFFRFRLKGDPYDRKGGFLSSVWLVQLAINNELKATVGLNGKSTTNDYIYVANADGTNAYSVYSTDNTGINVPGTRIVPAENGHYFLDIQVPIAEISRIAPDITSSTDIKLYFGSSKAANLSVINKEWMNNNYDFSGLTSVKPNTQAPSISIDGGESKVYTNVSPNDTMTGLVSDSGATVSISIDGAAATNVTATGNTWSYVLPVSITGSNGTHKAEVSYTNGTTVTAKQDIIISHNVDTDSVTIDGGAVAKTSSATPTLSGTYKGTHGNSANVRVKIDSNAYVDATTDYSNTLGSGTWTYSTNLGTPTQGQVFDIIVEVYKTNDIYAQTSQKLTYDNSMTINPITVAIGSVTGDSKPSFDGTSSGADKVELKIDGITVEIATPDGSGNWSVPSLEKPLSIGEHTVTAVGKNSSGNEVIAKTTHTVTQTDISIDNGSSVTLNDNVPTIKGSTNAVNGSPISVVIDGTGGGTYDTTANNGRYMVEVTSPLADGLHGVTATVGTANATQNMTIDTGTTVEITAPSDGSTVSEKRPAINGTSEANSTIDLRIIDSSFNIVVIKSLTSGSNGVWTYTPEADLSDGSYSVQVTSSDEYGNTATDSNDFTISSVTYTISLSTAPTFTDKVEGYSAITEETVTITNTGTGGITGLAAVLSGTDADSFTLGSLSSNSITSQSGTSTFTVVPKTGLSAGTYTATVTVTANNSVSENFNVSFTVTAAPTYTISLSTAPTFTDKVEGYSAITEETVTITNTGTGGITGLTAALSGTDADSFTLGSLSSDNIASQSGTSTFTVVPKTGLSAGTYTATVTVTANNSASENFNVSFIVTAVPTYTISLLTAPTFTDKVEGYSAITEETVTITNTGTGSIAGLKVALSGTNANSFTLGSLSSTSIASQSGTATFTVVPNTGLGAGTYTATVTVTANNSVSENFNVSFTVTAAPTYTISLLTAPTFTDKVEGYSAITEETVTITNTGTGSITGLSVALSGTNANSFTLGSLSSTSIASQSGTSTFTVVPKTGLSAGTYTATVTVSADHSISNSFNISFTVRENSRNSTNEADPIVPVVEDVYVSIETGEITNNTVVSQEKITRTTDADGQYSDSVTLTKETTEGTIEKVNDSNETVARIVIPDAEDKEKEIEVNIPKSVSELASSQNIDIEIQTSHGKVTISPDSLKDQPEDFYFRIVPIREPELQKQVENQAVTDQITVAASKGANVVLAERPYTIETNMSSRPVTVVLPLKDTLLPADDRLRDQYVKNMFIYIQHTDGEKEIIEGRLVQYDNTGLYGLEFNISKFSTFAIVNMQTEITDYSIDGQLAPSVINPLTGEISVLMPANQDLTDLIAHFELSPGSTATVKGIVQISGITSNDFTNAVQYIVTSDTGASKTWTMYVRRAAQKEYMSVFNIGSHLAYIRGYEDNTFKPENNITRAEMAAILDRLTSDGLSDDSIAENTFKDISNSWARESIEKIARLNIMNGYEDGTARPNNAITRAEFATLVYNWLKLKPVDGSSFKDIGNHWAESIISTIYSKNIMIGEPDGHFRPNDYLTRAEAVTIINKLLARGPLNGIDSPRWPDVSFSYWAFKDIEEASTDHKFNILNKVEYLESSK